MQRTMTTASSFHKIFIMRINLRITMIQLGYNLANANLVAFGNVLNTWEMTSVHKARDPWRWCKRPQNELEIFDHLWEKMLVSVLCWNCGSWILKWITGLFQNGGKYVGLDESDCGSGVWYHHHHLGGITIMFDELSWGQRSRGAHGWSESRCGSTNMCGVLDVVSVPVHIQ